MIWFTVYFGLIALAIFSRYQGTKKNSVCACKAYRDRVHRV